MSVAARIDACAHLTRRPVLAADVLDAWERDHGVILPGGYRDFLLEIGNGVDSDGFAMYGLDQAELFLEAPLTEPFPYSTAYGDQIRRALAARRPGDDFFAAMEPLRAGQHRGTPPGCLTIGDGGGGEYSYLVITGEERGLIWHGGDLDVPESLALYQRGGHDAIDFAAWLGCWMAMNGVAET